MKYQYSNFTDFDLQQAEARYQEIEAYYYEWLPTVQRWQKDKDGWFKRTKRDWWNGVLAERQAAKDSLDFIYRTMENDASTDFNDLALNGNHDDANDFPWTTVGIATGVALLIVAIYKII